jgi:hypothetical protein
MDLTPIYLAQKLQLHGKLQNQSIVAQKEKDEFRKFLEDLKLFFLFLDHGKVLNPNKPNAKLMLRIIILTK